jgi:hypothetical protein
MTKVAIYLQGFTGDKNIEYVNLHINEKYLDLLQMFTDNNLEFKVKYEYYNFLPKTQGVISHVLPRELYRGCKPHVSNCNELLKRINRIMKCSWDPETSYCTSQKIRRLNENFFR